MKHDNRQLPIMLTLSDDIDWVSNSGDVQTRTIEGIFKCGTRSYELQNVCRAARAYIHAREKERALREAVRDLAEAGKRLRNKSDQQAHLMMGASLKKHAAIIAECQEEGPAP